jgi:hypothetical protein
MDESYKNNNESKQLRKRNWVLWGCFYAIMIPSIFIYAYIDVGKFSLKREVLQYLSEKGHEKNEIKEIKSHFARRLPMFSVTVIFKDEPDVTYEYWKDEGQKKIQFFIVSE